MITRKLLDFAEEYTVSRGDGAEFKRLYELYRETNTIRSALQHAMVELGYWQEFTEAVAKVN